MSESPPAELVYLNGEIVAWENAKIHVFSAVAKAGAGVFEGLRAYWNDEQQQLYVFRMHEHMKRMEYSQRVMRFERIVSAEEASDATLELLRAIPCRANAHIRPTAFIEGFDGPPSYGPVGFAVTAISKPQSPRVRKGVSAQISSWHRLSDSSMPVRVKCNANYNNNRMALMQAHADGYEAAIFLTAGGKVSEGAGMCLFMIRDGVAVTPPVTADILESITRLTVIDLLRDHFGLETVQRDIDRSELYAAEEVFFCGTGWEISPVTSVDRLPVGTGAPGPMVIRLQDIYFDVVAGRLPGYDKWLTPVYPK